jgi:hypothetical protein
MDLYMREGLAIHMTIITGPVTHKWIGGVV